MSPSLLETFHSIAIRNLETTDSYMG